MTQDELAAWDHEIGLCPKRLYGSAWAIAMGLVGLAAPSLAAVTISAAPTSGIVCAGGQCTPTASDAVLNVGDLQALLASGSVEADFFEQTIRQQAVGWASPTA